MAVPGFQNASSYRYNVRVLFLYLVFLVFTLDFIRGNVVLPFVGSINNSSLLLSHEVFSTSGTDMVANASITAPTIKSVQPSTVTGGTVGPPQTTRNLRTAKPPPPADLCGILNNDLYDITTLTAVPYWVYIPTNPDLCLEGAVQCVYQIAFCRSLPRSSVTIAGTGAIQKTLQSVLILGKEGTLSKSATDTQGLLQVTYAEGAKVGNCENRLSLIVNLHCQRNAVWQVPADSAVSGIMPSSAKASYNVNNCQFTIDVNYSGACSVKRISGGSIIIIIFFSAALVYLISGAIYNKFGGAEGLEIIPNYQVWRMLPIDIMGGFIFTWNVITCKSGLAKAAGYDDI